MKQSWDRWLQLAVRPPASCVRCGYRIGSLDIDTCPECGHRIVKLSSIEARRVAHLQQVARWSGFVSIVVLPLAALVIAAGSRFSLGHVSPPVLRAIALLSLGSTLVMSVSAVSAGFMALLLGAATLTAVVSRSAVVVGGWLLVAAAGAAVVLRGWSPDWFIASICMSLCANLWILGAASERIERVLDRSDRRRSPARARTIWLAAFLVAGFAGMAAIAMNHTRGEPPAWLWQVAAIAVVVGLGAGISIVKDVLRILGTQPE